MNLYVLVGNIGSGKSTFTKKFLDRRENKTVCICRDALRYMIGGGEYTFDLNLEPAIIKSNLCIVRQFMKLGVNILIDETNISAKYRADYLDLADEFDYDKTAIIFPQLSREESINRRMNNPHGTRREVWYGVWDKFNSLYQTPTIEEGFDVVKFICENCYGRGTDVEYDRFFPCGDCNGTGFIQEKRK